MEEYYNELGIINNPEPMESDLDHIEILDHREKISKRTSEILSQMELLKREYNEIVSKCKHIEHTIKLVSPNGNISKLRKVCIDCKSIIGFPSTEEYNKWISE
jgi:uncharacterized protein YnzC (UPF0291/DUF896 family)